jgi:hypothetical protein
MKDGGGRARDVGAGFPRPPALPPAPPPTPRTRPGKAGQRPAFPGQKCRADTARQDWLLNAKLSLATNAFPSGAWERGIIFGYEYE